MKKQDFINFIQSQSNITLSEFICQRLNDFINAPTTSESEFDAIAQKLIHSKKRFINDSDLLEVLKITLWEQASERAKGAKIAKYKGSRWEEQHILAMYFYRKEAQQRGIEWIL